MVQHYDFHRDQRKSIFQCHWQPKAASDLRKCKLRLIRSFIHNNISLILLIILSSTLTIAFLKLLELPIILLLRTTKNENAILSSHHTIPTDRDLVTK